MKIISSFKYVYLVLWVLLSAGCVTYNPPITSEQLEGIDSALPVIVSGSPALASVKPMSNNTTAGAAGFGVLGVLVAAAVDAGVNSGRMSAGANEADALQEYVEGYDFNKLFEQDLEDKLGELPYKVGPIASSNEGNANGNISIIYSMGLEIRKSILLLEAIFSINVGQEKVHPKTATYYAPVPSELSAESIQELLTKGSGYLAELLVIGLSDTRDKNALADLKAKVPVRDVPFLKEAPGYSFGKSKDGLVDFYLLPQSVTTDYLALTEGGKAFAPATSHSFVYPEKEAAGAN